MTTRVPLFQNRYPSGYPPGPRRRPPPTDLSAECEDCCEGVGVSCKYAGRKWKPILFVIVVLLLFIFRNAGRANFKRISQTDTCPACYGKGLCQLLNHIQADDGAVRTWMSGMSVKNVHMATASSGRQLVVKALAHDGELRLADAKLCQGKMDYTCESTQKCSGIDVSASNGCNVAQVAASRAKAFRAGPLVAADIVKLSDLTVCASDRLAHRIADRFTERTQGYLTGEEKMMIVYTLVVNSEAITIQAFPSSEGWPFPRYIGACGRLVMEEYVGKPIKEYFNSPWRIRVDLSWQILRIADQFTTNAVGFKLYWTDVSFDNLAVSDLGRKVIVVDAENIHAIDAYKILDDEPPGYDQLDEHVHVSDCSGNVNCIQFDPTKWCSVTDSDFNYYAVCLSLLSSHALDDQDFNGGLLHDLPDDLEEKKEILNLLEECVVPTQPRGRIIAKDRLEVLLNKIR